MQLTEVQSTKDLLENKFIWEGEVIDVLNGDKDGIIKIRIPELDNNISDAEIPVCLPLMNFSFLKILPKKGERVTSPQISR